MADKSLRQLEEERRVQKEILDTILAQAKSDKDRIAIKKGLAEADKETVKQYKEAVSVLKELNEQAAELKAKNKEKIDILISEEARLKGLTGLQSLTVEHERKKIGMLAAMPGLNDKIRASVQTISGLNQELLATSAEDVVTRNDIKKKIEEELATLKGKRGVHGQLAKLMQQEYETADGVSSMTEKQQKFLNKQLAVYEGIQDTIDGVLETASLLTSTVGGVLGSAIMGAGYAMEALGKTTRDFGGYLGGATVSATALGTIFPNAAEAAKSLSAEMGGLNDVSFQTQLNTNLMATNMGISVGEAAKITSAFARVTDGTAETAQNLAASTKEFAKQNGIIPSQAMGDIAANSERFAEFSPKAAEGLAMAAVQARKLGVDMGTLGKVTDSLLDFETSITKELELSAMLGKNINLNRARGLAYEGKMGAAVKETISQLGGVEAFNKMDVFQKRQAAEALGISVDELSKMANNMDKLNDNGELQKTTFETWNESLTAFATGPLGSTLKGMGGMVIAAGQFNTGLGAMGGSIGGLVKGTGQVLKNLLNMVAGPVMKGMSTIGQSIAGSGVGKRLGGIKDRLMAGVGGGKSPTDAIPKVDSKAGDGASKLSKGVGSIKMSSVLQGAAALVLIAGAMWILGKAMQEWQGIGFDTLLVAGAALLGLTLSLAAVGAIMTSGVGAVAIIAGAAAMLIIAGAMWVLGKALQEIAIGFTALGMIQPILSGLVGMVAGIFALAGAFGVLAGSLALLGIAGIAALPALMGLAVAGSGLGMLFGMFGGGGSSETSAIEEGSVSEYETQMLSKMDLLIQAVNTNRDVYMDGVKVTAVVEKFTERNTRNEFGVQGK